MLKEPPLGGGQRWRRTARAVQAAAALALIAALAALVVAVDLSAPLVGVAGAVTALGVFALVASILWRRDRIEAEASFAAQIGDRLGAVLEAVDQGVVLADDDGAVRIVNRRAAQLFDLDAHAFLGRPYQELLRTIARKLEEPEDFMEAFQEARDDEPAELRLDVEQLLPARRHLRLHSAPAGDGSAGSLSRIDVYTDVSEAASKTAEIESLLERTRKTAESYQRALLPESVPALPRLGLVAHYIGSSRQGGVCGDFYDFVPLRDGRVGLVVGDVCGTGPPAANDAALTRYTLRSLARGIGEPDLLLEMLNRQIGQHVGTERFVRLVLCLLDPERALIEYVNAGHVPPVLYRADGGRVEWLSEGGLPLGIEEDSQYKIARTELEPGDTLVLYSDGVTDANRYGRPFGQGKFSDLIEEYGVGTAGELVQAIRRAVEAWVPGGELQDDLAVLVCEVVPDATIGEPTRELVVPNHAARVRDIRSFVAEFLAELRAPVEASHDMVIATGEAAANAFRHGATPGRYNEVRVRCAVEGRDVSVTVADEGPGFAVEEQGNGTPDKFAAGGRGLFLMRQLVDEVQIKTSGDGTTVTLKRRLLGER